MTNFGERLAAAVRAKKTPVLVGLDPRWEALPEAIRNQAGAEDSVAKAEAYTMFCRSVIDVVAPLVPAVKPQVAFFEELGPPGMQALADVVGYARSRGLLVIVDAKRNDIGSTAEAYAAAYFGEGSTTPWPADALTISPYLGSDSLEPFVSASQQCGGGVFVLVKTSNPGSGQFQDLICEGRPLYQHVAQYIEKLAVAEVGPSGYGCVGAVVGATYPDQLVELRAAMPHAWLLIPGFGSQGGTAKGVAGGFDCDGLGAMINNSRGIIFAHQRAEYASFGQARWQDAVEAATKKMIAALRAETSAGKLSK
ncbi:MAG: orotidine-5'-phosphate decarboxylase [Pirellulales bacterium]|nr:orotidine-5'-phosphate decarboxylase [Pirellulales bacterium]